ncbi:MAG: ABC transporter ATP-binding protein [Solirubrobacteraceae bacterium]|nr:ABC transporter ATP-binding protein [Solirubrobacteraceae bacterium]
MADPPKGFDRIAYLQSSVTEPKSLKRLPQLAGRALALAHRSNPRLFWITTVTQLIAAAMLGLQVLLGGLAIQAVLEQADGGTIGPVLAPLIGLAAVTAISGLATSAQALLQRLLGEEVQLLTWTQILDVTTAVPLETFENPEFFDALQRVRTNAVIRPLTMSQGLVQLFGGLVGIAGLTVALVVIHPGLIVIFLLGGFPLWLLSRTTGRLEFRFRAGQTPQLRLRHYLTELLCGRDEAKEIRAFALGPVIYERWRQNYDEYLAEYHQHVRRRLGLATVGAGITTVVMSIAVGLLVWFVVEGTVEIAAAGAALIAIRLLAGRLQQTFSGITDLFESALFLRDYEEFSELSPPPEPHRGEGTALAPFTELRVEHVSFSYPGTEQTALRDVSLTLRAGEVVALVGENGSGKTTLAKLLGHVFSPNEGRILWDGVDASTLDPEEVRSHVGVIFQDFVRFQLSARENVGFGRAERMDDVEAIMEASRRGGAHDALSRLPLGYETNLGKEWIGGYDLSLGQWQRVALSRAFFRDAGFLVLDEPTASLDAKSEHELFEHVRRLADDRCLLLISHRFSTVKDADRIYVLHEGEIIEEGSHDELIELDGRYAEMFDLQARAYR